MSLFQSVIWFICSFIWLVLTIPACQAWQTPLSVTVFDRQDYRGQVKIERDGLAGPFVALQGSEKQIALTPWEVPQGLKRVRIFGDVSWKHYRQGQQTSNGAVFIPIIDITSLIEPLNQSKLAWSERLQRFSEAQAEFGQHHPPVNDTDVPLLEKSEPYVVSEIVAAQLRMGFALPAEHRELLQNFGRWTIEDSGLLEPNQLDRADRQWESVWGSEASDFRQLPAEVRQLFERAVMLYVEAGDGYAALLYCFEKSGPEMKGCYYWISQDEIVKPRRLELKSGEPRDYSSAMRWLIATQVLQPYESAFANELFVDFGVDGANDYQLDLQLEPKQPFRARFLRQWDSIQ